MCLKDLQDKLMRGDQLLEGHNSKVTCTCVPRYQTRARPLPSASQRSEQHSAYTQPRMPAVFSKTLVLNMREICISHTTVLQASSHKYCSAVAATHQRLVCHDARCCDNELNPLNCSPCNKIQKTVSQAHVPSYATNCAYASKVQRRKSNTSLALQILDNTGHKLIKGIRGIPL
jgi:hypothetical protein